MLCLLRSYPDYTDPKLKPYSVYIRKRPILYTFSKVYMVFPYLFLLRIRIPQSIIDGKQETQIYRLNIPYAKPDDYF